MNEYFKILKTKPTSENTSVPNDQNNSGKEEDNYTIHSLHNTTSKAKVK